MDRLSQLRGGAGGSRDTSLDGSPGDSFMTANDTPSKYYSLSEDDSFDITKDVSLATTSSESTLNDSDCFSNLSPIGKKDLLDYKIGKQIEAANILSGGVNIFDDNDNSYDGNELVIDDNVEVEKSPTLKSPENPVLPSQDDVDKSPSLKLPDSSDIMHDEAGGSSTLKSPGCSSVTLQDDSEEGEKSNLKSPENSDPPLDKVDELVEAPDLPIEQALEQAEVPDPVDAQVAENDNLPIDNGVMQVVDNIPEEVQENRVEVILQIDGNNVDAINIGTGLYLYRKEGQEELAAVQIVEDEEPSFKFLKVRENAEGNLEVYEEIQELIVVPQQTPVREGRPPAPIAPREVNKPVNQPSTSKAVEMKKNTPEKEEPVASTSKQNNDSPKDAQPEAKSELNINGKMVKISESRKSPLMAYHSTPNKEGIPLTKTMVDQQLHPNRHSDNIKKTIEVHTDNSKQKLLETPTKSKDVPSPDKTFKEVPQADKSSGKESVDKTSIVTKEIVPEVMEKKIDGVAGCSNVEASNKVDTANAKEAETAKVEAENTKVEAENAKAEAENTKVEAEKAKVEAENAKVSEMKAAIDKNEETEDKTLVSSKDEKKMPMSSKPSESPSVIPHTSGSVEIAVSTGNKIEEKGSLNAITADREDGKEKPTPSISSVAEAPIQIDDSEVKIPENKEKQHSVVISTNTVESDDMDVNDALVIEEHPIDNQLEIRELESTASSVEVQSRVNINRTKNHDLESNSAKLSKSVETKVINEESLDISMPRKTDTVATNPSSNCNINIITNDKSILENKSDDKMNTQNSLSQNEVNCTNSKDTQSNVNIKTIDKTSKQNSTVARENIEKPKTQNIEKPKAKDALVENKPTAVESTIDNAKVTDATYNLPNKPVSSKLEKKDKKQEVLTNTKDIKTPSLLPIKQQQPIILTKNTLVESNKEVNHKTNQNAIDTTPKSINNNHAAVPFGKWTEANRQDFLNKIKESKVPVNMSNANQLKQPNDLNRRDVLKKIDSQRQTYNANVKIQESLQKGNVKTETAAFASKMTPPTVTKREIKAPAKVEAPEVKPKPIVIKKPVQTPVQPAPQETIVAATVSSTTKTETQRKEINNQDLIDKTIEGIINRAVTGKSPEDVKQTVTEKPTAEKLDKNPEQKANSQPTLLDAIEMKMNELHGIPFVERPPHELPRPYQGDPKVSPTNEAQNVPQKVSKIPNLLPLPKSQQKLKDCEDDIINLETQIEKAAGPPKIPPKLAEKVVPTQDPKISKDKIITEKEFDKFARRNSVTYENCLSVTDSHQVIQTVIPREAPPKKISRNEQMLAEAKAKSPHKHLPIKQYHPSKAASKFLPATDQNKQYQSKLQLAYHTAITAKRRIDSPITIIEDKPVKVVYLDQNVSEFTTAQLNVQGRDLSPAKRSQPDAVTVGTGDSLDSDILDAMEEVRAPDDTRTKSKHQRKQVLTPVETPDLELIEPGDLGIEVSPKKKRKIEDRPERSPKNLVPKKSYLLGRTAAPAQPVSEAVTAAKIPPRDVSLPTVPPVTHNDTVSAIDNLVKAAELLENQSESMNASSVSVNSVDTSQATPVKRGRGRPRKNPLPPAPDVKVSPTKKPRLIDAKSKHISSSDDDSSDDDSMIKENWTMGKINEKIVCPICNKLFRSENVVFKHVKHCAGPSPSRSDQDKRSPQRARLSQESETRSRDSEPKSRDSRHDEPDDDLPLARRTTRKRKSKDSGKSSSSDEVIPVEPKKPIDDDVKKDEPRKTIRPSMTRINTRTNNLVCEICGKSFRQLSYLLSHKLQHKKDDAKRPTNETQSKDKSVFSCETCKKEFRKLHHLVQHRLIHNPVQSRALRKTSSEQTESKDHDASKMDDQSAGFRCEPCDKSFRKLHHLVEHRETHDGINRQRSNSVTQVVPEKEKPTPPPQCDICKKTFRKLHHLIEHKEQHLETSSEKSDDQKSVKSCLSTKDIIHECNLCYMVFPNEHSLNKHAVICLRKKKQSAAKQAAMLKEKSAEESAKAEMSEENKLDSVEVKEPQPDTDVIEVKVDSPEKPIDSISKVEVPKKKEESPKPVVKTVDKAEKPLSDPKPAAEKIAAPLYENPIAKVVNKPAEPVKIKEIDEIIVIEDTPKKKVPSKDKVAPTVTKRQKVTAPPAAEERITPAVSSDEDEIRYMLNPDFKEDSSESKNFMKVRAKKRSSLQIERPNSKDTVVRRRSLLQHPPKIPRLRAKSDDVTTNPLPKVATKPRLEKVEASTDSDDSDVKYSFPKTVPEKPVPVIKKESVAGTDKRRKTMVDKRKSLSAIAKRKSLGKPIAKPAAKPTPAKPIKRRTMAAEHRCDCGALFSSAALLARHHSTAHTPPRRSRNTHAAPTQPSRTSTAPTTSEKPTRKSVSDSTRKLDSVKTAQSRSRVHRGVPLPEKRVPRK